MRIAIDIDSTLHHYWDVLSEVSVRRFGIELPYDEQFTWGITRLRPEQLEICIEESHTDERILAGTPYPGAVQAVCRWHEEGHFVHVTSHRALDRRDATAAWLAADRAAVRRPALLLRQGLPLRRARDRPADRRRPGEPLRRARARASLAATIGHPWNRDVCEEEDDRLRAGLDRARATARAAARPGRAWSSGRRSSSHMGMSSRLERRAGSCCEDDLRRRDAAARTRRAYGVDLASSPPGRPRGA